MPWTHFWDMHSGGGTKEPPYEHIYIEASQAEAELVFYNRFGHNPNRVGCTCCGEDYSISEYPTLKQATDYQRIRTWSGTRPTARWTLAQYKKQRDVLIISAADIKPDERRGSVPRQGFVWIDDE